MAMESAKMLLAKNQTTLFWLFGMQLPAFF
jgi:hypothetical protein